MGHGFSHAINASGWGSTSGDYDYDYIGKTAYS